MPAPVIFLSEFTITEGHLDSLRSAVRDAITFVEANGPQLLVEFFIDEDQRRAHSVQVYPDAAAILTHWELSQPYIQAVNDHVTPRRLDVLGDPGDQVRDGLRQAITDSVAVTVTPHVAGFHRLAGKAGKRHAH